MKSYSTFVLIAVAVCSVFAAEPANWLSDTADKMPDYLPKVFAYAGGSMNCWTIPALDHTGKPHHHGHLVQVVADGGNGVQDPPNADGTPGGDDSLAIGSFNVLRVMGLEWPGDTTGQTGMFYSHKYFIPIDINRAYYLRLWEGTDPRTAPYYQDTAEYTAGEDRGGTMIRLHAEGGPTDIDWKFGPSKPRPEKLSKKKG